MSEEKRQQVAREPVDEVTKGPATIAPARVWRAFLYSMHGFAGAWRTEGAFRQEVLAAIVLIPLAIWLPVSAVEHILLVGSVLLVMVVELLNSSVEAAIDRISAERHPLSKKAKDQGSAAVLLAITIALLAWGWILGPVAWRSLL
jgi:diacylglycerol kinase (ATP)